MVSDDYIRLCPTVGKFLRPGEVFVILHPATSSYKLWWIMTSKFITVEAFWTDIENNARVLS